MSRQRRKALVALWDEGLHTGTQPVQSIYAQNLDLSSFPLLCECVYADLNAQNPRLRSEMPFCAFQHVMTSILNAVIIDQVKVVNAEGRFAGESPLNLIPEDMVIPAPIVEFFKMIANTTTPQGDFVRANFSDAVIPRVHAEAHEQVPEIPAGSFGVCEAANHNAYECAVAPYVTGRLVVATRDQNVAGHFENWDPLPVGVAPANATPNENLLGYKQNVERLNNGGLQCLLNVDFPKGLDMQSRLQWSSELTARVSGALRIMESKYKMVVGKPTHGVNTSALGWIEVESTGATALERNSARLSRYSGPVNSPVALGSSQCYQVVVFGLKRKRTLHAQGHCYTAANGATIAGWGNTINSNFNMVAPFGPTVGQDSATFRQELHTSPSPLGDRSTLIMTWSRRNFIPKKNTT